jgi:ankyrin repeat protein
MEEYFQIALDIDKKKGGDYVRIEKFINLVVDMGMATEYDDNRKKIQTALLQKATSGYAEFMAEFERVWRSFHIHFGVHFERGLTALHYAAGCDDTESIRTLLNRGTPTDAKTEYGYTPFHWAAWKGGVNAMTVLVEEGNADVRMVDRSRKTALHGAAAENQAESIKELLKYGLDTAAQDRWKYTPLHWAARMGGTAAIEVLVEIGNADVQVRDGSGRTALHLAAIGNHTKSIRTLLKYGSDTAAQDVCDYTPLLCAARNGQADAIRVLVEEGKADVQVRDRRGRTALDLAAKWNFPGSDFPGSITTLLEYELPRTHKTKKDGRHPIKRDPGDLYHYLYDDLDDLYDDL